MGTGRARRRRRPAAVDRISDLPDEILHIIILRLPSTAEAARTSVLSRRWRRVWPHVPALSFTDGDQASGVSIYDAIDAALDACAAKTLGRLKISIRDPGARVLPWLRFASERLAGELSLRFTCSPHLNGRTQPMTEVELPVCQRVTAIDLYLPWLVPKLRIPAAGAFAALRVLKIYYGSVEVSELERAVSSQCPRLQDVTLFHLAIADGLSLRSDSLERLKFGGSRIHGEVTVQAPRLVRLQMTLLAAQKMHGLHIAAPDLVEVIWHDTYDSQCHEIVEAGRHLRRLEVLYYLCQDEPTTPTMAGLFQRFDTVDELNLQLNIPWVGDGEGFEYEEFWLDTAKLPQCKVLKICLTTYQPHAFEAILSHLLRKCSSARRLVFLWISAGKVPDYPRYKDEQAECTCCGQLGTDDGVVMDSLEEVELSFSRVGVREEGLVKLLVQCGGASLRRLDIHMQRGAHILSTTARKRIAGFCRPETRVDFYAS